MDKTVNVAAAAAAAAHAMTQSPEMKAKIMRDAIEDTIRSFRAEGQPALADQTRTAIADADDGMMAKLYDLMFVSSGKPDALRRARGYAAKAGYTQDWQAGQMLVCDEGTNFIPAGTVVVFKERTFAPFVKVLIPGLSENAVGHFEEDDFRPATPAEIHAALNPVREDA